MPPTSGISVSASSVAAISASMEPKWAAMVLAAFSPTCRMPRPYSRRLRSLALEFSMARIRFSADFSPIRSSLATSAAWRLYRSAALEISPESISCWITAGTAAVDVRSPGWRSG